MTRYNPEWRGVRSDKEWSVFDNKTNRFVIIGISQGLSKLLSVLLESK